MSDGPDRSRARRLRILAVLLLLPVCCIAWELLRGAAGFSIPRLLATAASLLLAAALAALVIGPDRWRTACDRFFLDRLAWLQSRTPVSSRWWCWLAIVIAWSSFLGAIQRGAPLQNLRTTDSAAFSRYASDVRQEGGPLALVGDLYGGRYGEANQHPLLIGILSTVDTKVIFINVKQDGSGFDDGKTFMVHDTDGNQQVFELDDEAGTVGVSARNVAVIYSSTASTSADGMAITIRDAIKRASEEGSLNVAATASGSRVTITGGRNIVLGDQLTGLELSQVNLHQLVTMGISLAGFILVTLLVIRLAGHQVGAVFAALLGTNATFGHLSLQVTCECLLIPLVTLCWWSFQRWTQTAGRPSPWRVMIAAGAVLGLVQLAKGTGAIFLAGTLAWLLLPGCCFARPRPDPEGQDLDPADGAKRGRLALILLAAWITIASPLLVRNLRVYGHPLYNVNSHFLFMDEFENPSEVSRRITIGEAAKEYFATHGIGEMVQREATGLSWESFNMARLLGPQPLEDSRLLPGILLLLLALLGIGLCPGRGYLLLACWLLLMIPLFAWYDPIVRSGERFLAPLIPALLFYAAVAACRLLSPASTAAPTKARQSLLPLACIAWCLIWNGATWIGYGTAAFRP
jgi:hypothetical protein